MTQTSIVCFGDALIDLLQAPESDPPRFTGFAGGAPANVAAAVARLGGQAYFAGTVGADEFGHYLQKTLSGLDVDISMMPATEEALTPLAIVNLGADGERSFSFYHIDTAPHYFRVQDFREAIFQTAPIFHFVSNIITTPQLLATTQAGIDLTRSNSGLVSFDVNLRPNFWTDTDLIRPHIEQLLTQADILKVSEEELDFLVQKNDPEQIINSWLAAGVGLVCVTRDSAGVDFYTSTQRDHIPAFTVKAVDATGAGDAFIGGVLYGLARQLENCAEFTQWLGDAARISAVLRTGAACGAIAVSRYGAIPSLPTQADIAPLLTSA